MRAANVVSPPGILRGTRVVAVMLEQPGRIGQPPIEEAAVHRSADIAGGARYSAPSERFTKSLLVTLVS